jgi:hypothetical protein
MRLPGIVGLKFHQDISEPAGVVRQARPVRSRERPKLAPSDSTDFPARRRRPLFSAI